MQTLDRPGLATSSPGGRPARRPGRLLQRLQWQWYTDRAGFLGAVVSLVVVAGVVAFVFVQLQPSLLFGPNMDVGGDTAAHVVAVNYLIHHLLPDFQLTGWDPEWFGGFPLYAFYFPLPALIVAIFNLVIPYTVAFKMVTALGILLMPVAAYTFGRLAGYRRPLPALMSAGVLPFLFLFASNTDASVYISWSIDGGTIASTMAGEFSFTLSVSCMIFFLGVFLYALRTGRLRWLAALLFLATLLCHVVPAMFAAFAAVVLTLVCGRLRSLWSVLVPVGVAGGLLTAFWLLPFGAYLHYTSSMGYNRVTAVYQNLIPQNGEQAVQWLALLGLGLAVLLRDRVALGLAALAAFAGLAFLKFPSGQVYNGRWLPFWFVTTGLLAAYAVAELGRILFVVAGSARWHAAVTGLVGGAIPVVLIAGWLGVLPGVSIPGAEVNPVSTSWVAFNYSGYQARPGWAEFSSLTSMLDRVTKRYGCGRLDYEYSPNLTNVYGSTLVPMSLPMWTDGCIDTTEGLYYESSTTTPFHFLDQSELSVDSSDPVVGIPYQPFDVADGIRHLQLMGVKYYLANSPQAEAAAAKDPSLTEVGTSPITYDGTVDGTQAADALTTAPSGSVWALYLISDSALVAPLSYEPAVEPGLSKQAYLDLGISWYQNEQYWPVPIARAGPSSWPREVAGTLVSVSEALPVTPAKVSHIRTTESTVSFDVSRTGSPVLVKVPYFPNWQASGATGPWEVTPNSMVVVPTSRHVTLHYGTTGIDVVGKVASVLGIGAAALLVRPTANGLRPDVTGHAGAEPPVGAAQPRGAGPEPETGPPSGPEPGPAPEPGGEPTPEAEPADETDLGVGAGAEPGAGADTEPPRGPGPAPGPGPRPEPDGDA